jgi:hypothetical protein
MQERVLVNIGPDGAIQIAVEGVKGKSCSDLTRELEKSLGRTTKDLKKPEFHQQSAQGARHAQR